MQRTFANSRWVLVFLTAAAVAQVAGQPVEPEPSTKPAGGTQSVAEQQQPAAQQTGAVERPPETAEPQKKAVGEKEQAEGITLNFQDAPLMDLVKFVADAMGLPVIAETEITGRVSVYNARPVDLQQTLAICNSVLKARGLVAFRSGNVLKVVPLSDAKRHEIAVKHVEQAGDVPETDTIETYVIPLRFADATRLKEDLKDLIGSYGSITADAASNTIIITDTGKNVRRLVSILRSIDARLSQDLTIRVFVLANADATELANVILQVFRGDPRRHQQRLSPWTYRRGASPRTSGSSAVRADVNVVADARTNSLIVTASKDSMELISSLVEQLDVQPQAALEEIRGEWRRGEVEIGAEFEDIHEYIEARVIEKIGIEAGGMLHTGRSRNDQVMVDVRLRVRDEILEMLEETSKLGNQGKKINIDKIITKYKRD